MSNITNQFYLNKIKKNPNKSNWRIRNMVSIINTEISQYRLLAMKSRGYIRDFCNKEANDLEKQLNDSLNGSKFETNRKS